MKRINGMVSDPAKTVLVEWKATLGVTTLDEALDSILLEFGAAETARKKENATHIDECTTAED